MLSVFNSFKEALYGNFVTMFGLDKVCQFATNGKLDFSDGVQTLVISIIVSMMFMVLAGSVIAAFVAIVIFRIVTLWVLLITSPMAYALAILPQVDSYAKQWWSMFTDQLTR